MVGLRELNKSKRRAAILDATTVLLRVNDFRDVTVDQIAALAEVSPHTVYNLIGTRDDIVFALLGRVVRSMADPTPSFDAGLGDPSEPLRLVFDHAVDALLAEPDVYRQIVRIGASLPDWPAEGSAPPHLVARAARMLAVHESLRPGIDERLVARHAYHGFIGWLLAWGNGRTSNATLRREVRQHVAIVLAATTTGAVRDRAAAELAGAMSR